MPDDTTLFPFAHSPEVVQVAFGPDDTLYVAANTELVNLWAVIVSHWPELLGVVLGVVLLVALVRFVSVMRRPQVVGRVYCRGCNYDVSDTPETCPECGRALAKVPARRGRTRRRRLVRPAALAGVAMVLYALPWFLGVGRDWPWLAGRAHWYSSDAVTWIRDHNAARYAPFIAGGTELLGVDMAKGTWRRIAFVDDTFAVGLEFELMISPDGRWTVMNDRGHTELVAIELKRGRVIGRLEAPGLPSITTVQRSGWSGMAGFAPDSRTVYAARSDQRQQTTALHAWNPFADEMKQIVEVSSDVFKHPQITMVESRGWRVIPTDHGPAFLSCPSMYAFISDRIEKRQFSTAVLFDEQGEEIERFPLEFQRRPWPEVRADGAILYLSGQPPRPWKYIVGEGATPLALQAPPLGSRPYLDDLLLSASNSHLMARAHRQLLVWEANHGRYLGGVALGDHIVSEAAFSARGDRAAIVVQEDDGAGGWDMRVRTVMLTDLPWWPAEEVQP
ncbi:MAG: hypothetical protein KDA21_07070, partial [Phycisphaerales bacterium]|nr:hypothetical protein [Phycisphaerales bacterium]